MRQPRVSVIVVAFASERWDRLCAALSSLRVQTRPPEEIVVVIDHNPALLRRVQAAFSDLLVIPNTQMQGASGARNSGVAASSGEIVAFIDDDVVASPTWLDRLLPGFANPEVLGIGGAITPDWDGHRPGWFPDEFLWVVSVTYRGLPTETTSVRNLIAANMSVRRSVFESVGGFRRGFGKVGSRPRPEETDFCIMARKRWPTGHWLYEPSALVAHFVPSARMRLSYFVRRCYEEGRGKADLARLVGAQESLAAEKDYVRKILPSGAARGMADLLRKADPFGPTRTLAIAAGLTATAGGYLHGGLRARLGARDDAAYSPPAEAPYGPPSRAVD